MLGFYGIIPLCLQLSPAVLYSNGNCVNETFLFPIEVMY